MAPLRRLSAVAVAVLLAGSLTGCAGAVTPKDLVGTYSNSYGLIELRVQPGGRAVASLLDTEGGVATGSCTWTLLGSSSAFGPQRLELDFSNTPDTYVGIVDYDIADGGRSISYTSQAANATVTLRR